MPSNKAPQDTAENYILANLGVNREVVAPNLSNLYNLVGQMESDNREDATNPNSSAKGVYQFLNENGTGEDKFKGSSFDVALNRATRAYVGGGSPPPKWIAEAKEHKDPRKLTRQQADVLMLADLYLRPGKTSPMIKKFLVEGDTQALADLYARYHHTGVNDEGQGDVTGRMEKIFGAKPSENMY
jgi:hypothetical protein